MFITASQQQYRVVAELFIDVNNSCTRVRSRGVIFKIGIMSATKRNEVRDQPYPKNRPEGTND